MFQSRSVITNSIPRCTTQTHTNTLFQISSGIPPSVQTLSDVCSQHTCSLDISAFSTLEVLDDNHAV